MAITAVGAVPRGRFLTRAGARPGDLLLGSGTFGDAALGMEPGAAPALVRRQRRPTPRLALGRALTGIATAAIDVSDGLAQDLGHVAEASRVAAVLEESRVPISPAYRRRAAGLADPMAAALAGGEDYELLVAVPPARLARGGGGGAADGDGALGAGPLRARARGPHPRRGGHAEAGPLGPRPPARTRTRPFDKAQGGL